MIRSSFRIHFVHHCVQYTLVFLEEGNHHLPHCTKFNVFVYWRSLNRTHWATTMCAKEAEWKLKWLREEEAKTSTEVAFQAYGRPLETVTEFNYFRWVLTTSDDDWPLVVEKL